MTCRHVRTSCENATSRSPLPQRIGLLYVCITERSVLVTRLVPVSVLTPLLSLCSRLTPSLPQSVKFQG